MVKDDYMKPVPVTFEGHTLRAPANYDTYLRQLYGDDYMKIPNAERRYSHGFSPYHSKTETLPLSVAMCGLLQSENLGEAFIADSLKFLIGKVMKERGYDGRICYSDVDILGLRDETFPIPSTDFLRYSFANVYGFRFRGALVAMFYRRLKFLARDKKSMTTRNLIYRLQHFIWIHGKNFERRMDDYLKEKMENTDLIVIDGAGLLEYSFNEYQEYLRQIIKFAEKKSKPVIINAIGRAGEFDLRDYRCKVLMKALSSDVVKYVSARDSAENVQACMSERHQVKLLADAAFWLKETYQPQPVERKIIGIGIIRGNALSGYGYNFDSIDWIRLFAGIAEQLRERGYDFRFFTNGMRSDM